MTNIIVDGKKTTLAEYESRNDGRVEVSRKNVHLLANERGGEILVITTAPPTDHLPHVKRMKANAS